MAVDDSYTKSLLHFDGVNGSTTFVDESGKIWTPSGDAVISTAHYKFGGSSVAFNNGAITTPDSSDFSLSTNDFTIDFWVYFNSLNSTLNRIASNGNDGDGTGTWWVSVEGYGYSLYFRLRDSAGATYQLLSNGAMSASTWYHIAVVRYANTAKLYINGIAQSTTVNLTGKSLYDSASVISLGGIYGAAWRMAGYIDEFRLSNGIARWTSNFTPPTRQYGAMSGSVCNLSQGFGIL